MNSLAYCAGEKYLAGVTLAGSALYASFIFVWLLGIIFQYVMFDIGLFGWMGFVSFVLTNNLNPVYPFFLVYYADRYYQGSLQDIPQTGGW